MIGGAEIIPGHGSRGGVQLQMRRGGRHESVDLVGVKVRRRTELARLGPASTEGFEVLFWLTVLPLRLTALTLLWATSSSKRAALVVMATVAAVIVAVI